MTDSSVDSDAFRGRDVYLGCHGMEDVGSRLSRLSREMGTRGLLVRLKILWIRWGVQGKEGH